MSPKQTVQTWVEHFNRGDVSALAELYHPDAINHQVFTEPFVGRTAIRNFLQAEFDKATMVCIVETLYEDGNVAIMEWRDPLGLRGCGFFTVENGLITFQRGYFDRLSFLQQQGLPIEI